MPIHCMCAYAMHTRLVHTRDNQIHRNGCQVSWNWSYRWLWGSIWVLWTESRSSASAASALSYWALSLAPQETFVNEYFQQRLFKMSTWAVGQQAYRAPICVIHKARLQWHLTFQEQERNNIALFKTEQIKKKTNSWNFRREGSKIWYSRHLLKTYYYTRHDGARL